MILQEKQSQVLITCCELVEVGTTEFDVNHLMKCGWHRSKGNESHEMTWLNVGE